jgi:hypothetical protein
MSPGILMLLGVVADLRLVTLLVAIPLTACAAAPPYAPWVWLRLPRRLRGLRLSRQLSVPILHRYRAVLFLRTALPWPLPPP